MTANDLKLNEGIALWEFINQLKIDKGHKYTFKKYPTESEKKILDEILKELKKVKQPKIYFNEIFKDDSN